MKRLLRACDIPARRMPGQDGQKAIKPMGADSDSSIASDCRYYEGQDLEALADLPAYHDWILDQFHPYLQGRVIEIGAGLGNIASRYADSVEELLLVEPAENLHSRLKKRFETKPHVRTACALVEGLRADVAAIPGSHGAPFDAAVLVNVLEHVVDQASMLKSIRGILRPQGALLLFVPALPWLYGTLDEKVGHERRYTRRELAQIVEQAGFSIERIRYFDLLGVLPWLFAARVRQAEAFSDRAAKLYDRWVVPIARAMEKQVKPPIGKNLLCVARVAQPERFSESKGDGHAPSS